LTTADDRKTALLLQCRNRAIAAFADAAAVSTAQILRLRTTAKPRYYCNVETALLLHLRTLPPPFRLPKFCDCGRPQNRAIAAM